MKLTQKILLQNSEEFIYSDWLTASYRRINLNLAHFTGLQSVYFKCQSEQLSAAHTYTVRLYNYTDSETIQSWLITDAAVHDLVSDDLKAFYSTEKIIGVTVEATSGSPNVFLRDARLELMQDTSVTNRQTELFLPINVTVYSTSGTPWTDAFTMNFTVPIDKFDGEVSAIFETCMRTYAGAYTGKIRLYDKTADAAVADSEIDFNYTVTPTMLTTPALTLIAGHEYQVQTSTTNTHQFLCHLPVIKIHAQAFTKCASMPVAWMPWSYGNELDAWESLGLAQSFAKSDITGDTVVYQYNQSFYYDYFESGDHGINLYNNTLSAIIAGTEHIETSEDPYAFTYADTPTLPDSCDLIRQGYSWYESYGFFPDILLAFQEEAFPPAPFGQTSTLPDPLQPSGYHCFMKQYVKNKIAGTTPWRLPDELY